MLAIVILVFVGFFCIRMLSNTKTACILTVTIFICLLFFLQIRFEVILPVIKAITKSIQRIVGAACCVLSAIAVVKGLADEENSEQYVHRRAYWCACIALLYLRYLSACSSYSSFLAHQWRRPKSAHWRHEIILAVVAIS